MIIDETYFVRKNNLPQTGNTDGLSEVQGFIDQYEPEYLKKALGYDLWKAFTDGIMSVSPAQKWLDLLEGKEYTYNGYNDRWQGFAPITEGGSYTISSGNSLELTTGGPDPNDPDPGTTITLPDAFQGVPLTVSIRGTGKLKTSEFTVVGNTLTLNGGLELVLGTIVFIDKGPRFSIISGDLLKISPIANYVFYQFIENNVSNVALIGTVTSQTDNNRNVNPVPQLITAWNDMVKMNRHLYEFLESNKTVYPEWTTRRKYNGWKYWWPGWYGEYSHPFMDYFTEVYDFKNSLDI